MFALPVVFVSSVATLLLRIGGQRLDAVKGISSRGCVRSDDEEAIRTVGLERASMCLKLIQELLGVELTMQN